MICNHITLHMYSFYIFYNSQCHLLLLLIIIINYYSYYYYSSVHILKYVSGLAPSKAQTIIDTCRNLQHQHGGIRSRKDLLKIKGLGPITYQNAAGFLRIYNGDEPLDATNVHPELYETVYKILKHVGFYDKYKDLQHRHIGSVELRQLFESVADWSVIIKKCDITTDMCLDIIGWLIFPNPYVGVNMTNHTNNNNINNTKTNNPTNSNNSSNSDSDLTNTDILILKGLGEVKRRRLCDIGMPPLLKKLPPSSSSSSSHNSNNRDSNNNQETSLSIGSVITGTVRNITPFGAFIDLGCEGRIRKITTSASSATTSKDNANTSTNATNNNKMTTGLLHSSLVDLNTLTIGQTLEVAIKDIDPQRGRVALTLDLNISHSHSHSDKRGNNHHNFNTHDDKNKIKDKNSNTSSSNTNNKKRKVEDQQETAVYTDNNNNNNDKNKFKKNKAK